MDVFYRIESMGMCFSLPMCRKGETRVIRCQNAVVNAIDLPGDDDQWGLENRELLDA